MLLLHNANSAMYTYTFQLLHRDIIFFNNYFILLLRLKLSIKTVNYWAKKASGRVSFYLSSWHLSIPEKTTCLSRRCVAYVTSGISGGIFGRYCRDIEGCDRQAQQGGICTITHIARTKRCDIEQGCEKQAKKGRLCVTHGVRENTVKLKGVITWLLGGVCKKHSAKTKGSKVDS